MPPAMIQSFDDQSLLSALKQGVCKYNPVNRVFTLNYSYVNAYGIRIHYRK
jgi:hypothetical protein